MAQTEEIQFTTLSLVWVNCPYPAVTLEMTKILEAKVCVYGGQEPPVDKATSSTLCCPSKEDAGSEVRRLRALTLGAPVLVLGLDGVDTQLARTALLAGAHGVIYPEMRPEQIVRALSVALQDKILLPRNLLEAFLREAASRSDLRVLTPRQRQFLELVAQEATFGREIVVPRGLLEAFLKETAVS